MRQLLGEEASGLSVSDEAVADSYPWPDAGPWVRAMMVTTLDGAAAGPDGLSGSVSSTADKAVFNAVRRYADVVLVGAQTIRAEQYKPMRAKPEDAVRRADEGQAPAPVVAVVSGSLDLPWHLPIWNESTEQPLVITSTSAAPRALEVAREHAEVVALPEVSPGNIIDALVARGLRRIVCEGGPSLLRDLLAADLVDEADITLSATFTGTANSPVTTVLPAARRFRLVQVLEQDGFLMTRHLVEGR